MRETSHHEKALEHNLGDNKISIIEMISKQSFRSSLKSSIRSLSESLLQKQTINELCDWILTDEFINQPNFKTTAQTILRIFKESPDQIQTSFAQNETLIFRLSEFSKSQKPQEALSYAFFSQIIELFSNITKGSFLTNFKRFPFTLARKLDIISIRNLFSILASTYPTQFSFSCSAILFILHNLTDNNKNQAMLLFLRLVRSKSTFPSFDHSKVVNALLEIATSRGHDELISTQAFQIVEYIQQNTSNPDNLEDLLQRFSQTFDISTLPINYGTGIALRLLKTFVPSFVMSMVTNPTHMFMHEGILKSIENVSDDILIPFIENNNIPVKIIWAMNVAKSNGFLTKFAILLNSKAELSKSLQTPEWTKFASEQLQSRIDLLNLPMPTNIQKKKKGKYNLRQNQKPNKKKTEESKSDITITSEQSNETNKPKNESNENKKESEVKKVVNEIPVPIDLDKIEQHNSKRPIPIDSERTFPLAPQYSPRQRRRSVSASEVDDELQQIMKKVSKCRYLDTQLIATEIINKKYQSMHESSATTDESKKDEKVIEKVPPKSRVDKHESGAAIRMRADSMRNKRISSPPNPPSKYAHSPPPSLLRHSSTPSSPMSSPLTSPTSSPPSSFPKNKSKDNLIKEMDHEEDIIEIISISDSSDSLDSNPKIDEVEDLDVVEIDEDATVMAEDSEPDVPFSASFDDIQADLVEYLPSDQIPSILTPDNEKSSKKEIIPNLPSNSYTPKRPNINSNRKEVNQSIEVENEIEEEPSKENTTIPIFNRDQIEEEEQEIQIIPEPYPKRFADIGDDFESSSDSDDLTFCTQELIGPIKKKPNYIWTPFGPAKSDDSLSEHSESSSSGSSDDEYIFQFSPTPQKLQRKKSFEYYGTFSTIANKKFGFFINVPPKETVKSVQLKSTLPQLI